MMDFEDWFYQTEACEEGKPVLSFDNDMSNVLSLVEVWLQVAYQAGQKAGLEQEKEVRYPPEITLILETLKWCEDVEIWEVPLLIVQRQRELEQEPEDTLSIYTHGMTLPTDKDYDV
jgi:hypothetical protein